MYIVRLPNYYSIQTIAAGTVLIYQLMIFRYGGFEYIK